MKRTLIAGTVILSCAAGLRAHHGNSLSDQSQRITLKGRVAKVHLLNPHTLIEVETKGSGVWTVEWLPPMHLLQEGLKPKELTLKAGDEVVIHGNPQKDAAQRRISVMTDVERPSDGWRWEKKVTKPAAPPEIRERTVE